LANDEIELQMLRLVDAYRADYEKRQPTSIPITESPRRKPRPLFVVPAEPHVRKAVMRCLVRRGL
jgi:hypothetical protein